VLDLEDLQIAAARVRIFWELGRCRRYLTINFSKTLPNDILEARVKDGRGRKACRPVPNITLRTGIFRKREILWIDTINIILEVRVKGTAEVEEPTSYSAGISRASGGWGRLSPAIAPCRVVLSKVDWYRFRHRRVKRTGLIILKPKLYLESERQVHWVKHDAIKPP
jgi:hypothetical protein